MKTIYCWNPKRGEYWDKFDMEEPYPGLTKNMTEIEPPAFGEKEIPMWEEGKWVIRPDYRTHRLWPWDNATHIDPSLVEPGKSLDDLKATDIPPPGDLYSWDMKTMSWVIDPKKEAEERLSEWWLKWYDAMGLISKAITIYQDEQVAGDNDTSLNPAEYRELVICRLALNRMKPLDPFPPIPKHLEGAVTHGSH